jgi:hypothetical protein
LVSSQLREQEALSVIFHGSIREQDSQQLRPQFENEHRQLQKATRRSTVERQIQDIAGEVSDEELEKAWTWTWTQSKEDLAGF